MQAEFFNIICLHVPARTRLTREELILDRIIGTHRLSALPKKRNLIGNQSH